MRRRSIDAHWLSTAFHEAGHAIAAYVILGASSIVRVELGPPGDPSVLGVCHIRQTHSTARGWHALAGPAAQQIAAEANGWNPRGLGPSSKPDLAVARQAFGGRLERWRMTHITEWLRSPDVWPWVERLARELVAKRSMEGPELMEMLEPMGWPAKPSGYIADFNAWAAKMTTGGEDAP